MPAAKPVVIWELARDDEACERAGAVVISWSGLAHADCRVLDSARGSSVTKAFLNAGAAWLDLELPIWWMLLATGIPPTSAPHDVPGAALSRAPEAGLAGVHHITLPFCAWCSGLGRSVSPRRSSRVPLFVPGGWGALSLAIPAP